MYFFRPIRLTEFVVGDSADVARWVAGEAQLATPHLTRLLHLVLDSSLYLHQSGLEFRDFHHATRTRLVSHILREHNSAADALANAGAYGHTAVRLEKYV